MMEYTPPPYESGLTAKLLYDNVEHLLRQRIAREGSHKLKETPLGLGKLWDEPSIRKELEEFVQSYFFTDVKPSLKDILTEQDAGVRNRSFADYVGMLEKEYGSRDRAHEEVVGLLKEINKRGVRFFKEVFKIDDETGLNLTKINAKDAFGQIYTPLNGRVEIALAKLHIRLLVIDNESSILLSFYQALKDKRVVLDVTQTTAEGLDLMARTRYDLIFTDLMQQPSGIDVYSTAVSKGIEAHIITGGGDLLEEAIEVAGEDLLMKPFLIKEAIYPIIEKARQRKLEPPKP